MILPENLPRAALYESLAEEATELAHAALKMARILRGENPTPCKKIDIFENIIEELTDVTLVAHDALGIEINESIRDAKMKRWIQRLNEKEEPKNDSGKQQHNSNPPAWSGSVFRQGQFPAFWLRRVFQPPIANVRKTARRM